MCTYLIRKYIVKLRSGELFATRDVLKMGSRGAVDQCLYRMVKGGSIVRLARGVFVRKDLTNQEHSLEEIAKVKADAFGKQLLKHGNDVALKLGLKLDHQKITTFYTNGSTSYFHVGDTKIKMHRIASRKGIYLGENAVGNSIRALWQIGKKVVTPEQVERCTHRFNRNESTWLRECIRWMPEWLSSRCLSGRSNSLALLTVLPELKPGAWQGLYIPQPDLSSRYLPVLLDDDLWH